ncbi:hypothetical protein J2810_001220 [Chryseobacterium rhizosphaerae]|nr:hypothetical protein [Chryseobacterium rhizosphaerae]
MSLWLNVDPLAEDFPGRSPYEYTFSNPINLTDPDGMAPVDPKPGFWKSFLESLGRGVVGVAKHIINNPNHAGYGYSPNMKTPKVSDFGPYQISWSRQLDPYYQINSFSSSLVGGTVNFVGGLYTLDGARTARAIPDVASSWGVLFGFSKAFSVTSTGVARRALLDKAGDILSSSGKKPYVISAVIDSETGRVFYGTNRTIKSMNEVNPTLKSHLPKQSLEEWSTYNCAECDAFNSALNAGAKWKNLKDMHTMQFKNGKYIDFTRCQNCQQTFKSIKPTSE